MKSVEKYNPTTDTWCKVSPMLTPRRGLGAAILDGILYVVGGSDGIAAVNQVNLCFLSGRCHFPKIRCVKAFIFSEETPV